MSRDVSVFSVGSGERKWEGFLYSRGSTCKGPERQRPQSDGTRGGPGKLCECWNARGLMWVGGRVMVPRGAHLRIPRAYE